MDTGRSPDTHQHRTSPSLFTVSLLLGVILTSLPRSLSFSTLSQAPLQQRVSPLYPHLQTLFYPFVISHFMLHGLFSCSAHPTESGLKQHSKDRLLSTFWRGLKYPRQGVQMFRQWPHYRLYFLFDNTKFNVIIYLHLRSRVHVSLVSTAWPRGDSHLRPERFLDLCRFSFLTSLLLPVFSSRYDILSFQFTLFKCIMNIYGRLWDSKEGEKCEGGQWRLSTPTSLVMEITQCNIWIVIICCEWERATQTGREKEAESFNWQSPTFKN